MTTFLIILVVAATLFWMIQFLGLMMMPDDAFPGRYDKPIWAAVLIFLWVLSAILFVIWKATLRSDEEATAVAGQLDAMIRQANLDADAT